ncbi:hypothetical protein CDL12_27314 [Handroanthus impetiginosus]|uniref:Uncharacterized protein n=1 Tax=Handroanthus impetiginosus TaxID=429701 RepID=A0A2G9G4E3_9LAMI|nr:hypothetical protein CDL12_27314 [Handroanthus impetiginosus]
MKLFVTSSSTPQQIESQSNSILCHQDINKEHLKKVEIDHQSYQARLNLFLTEQLSTLNKRVTSIEGHVVNLMCRNVGYGENDNLDISKDQLMQLSCIVSELHTIVANLPQMIPNVVEDKIRL